MKTLFVFDEHVDLDHTGSFMAGGVDLFPLTGDFFLIKRVKEVLGEKKVEQVQLLDSAKHINAEVSHLRDNICQWSAKVGDFKVFSKSIKQWFLPPQISTSTWWFSLLSEKNTFKTDIFFNVARVDAYKKILASNRYGCLQISVLNVPLYKSLSKVAAKYGIRIKTIPNKYTDRKRDLIKIAVDRIGLIGELVRGILIFIRFFIQSIQAQTALPPIVKRTPDPDSLLLVSYFPAVESKAAERGVFKNKFYPVLQGKLREWDLNYAWLLMHVDMDGKKFKDSLELAYNFEQKGEKLFFLQEFFQPKHFLKCMAIWLRQACLSLFLYICVQRYALSQEPFGMECSPLFKKLWFQSFCGTTGAEGVLYDALFKNVFTSFPHFSDVIYLMEMHAWEKGLNAGVRNVAPEIRTIGFQHAAISSNYYHYFYDPSETIASGKKTDLPIPNVMAITGEHTKSLLSVCGYGNIELVESIKHIYVNKLLSTKFEKPHKKPVLLVAGSVNRKETKTLTSIVHTAFPKSDFFEIWFKAHPLCPFETIFEELDIDPDKSGYLLKGGNIADVLRESSAVFVPTSTVSIESLAFGCEVLIPILADSMLMNPLSDYEEFYHPIGTPSELKSSVEAILFRGKTKNVSDYCNFVKNYWLTDPELARWQALLNSEETSSKKFAKEH